MVTFDSQEAFDDAVMAVLTERVKVGVTVRKKREWECTEAVTKVEVSLTDRKSGNDIGRGMDFE